MRYVHGTDDRTRDRIRAFFYWMIAAFFAVVACGIALIVLMTVFSVFRGAPLDAFKIFLLVAGPFFAGLGAFYLAMVVWENARYTLTEEGIEVSRLFRTVKIEWRDVKGVLVRPIRVRRWVAHDYLIVRLTSRPPASEALAVMPDLTGCFIQNDDFLIVRCTDARPILSAHLSRKGHRKGRSSGPGGCFSFPENAWA
ncbi:MAG: hypothetical protein IK095_08600 [Oscillospiraceae bacterium]|nr:hypothetical protein [Oscillospiraceae bacterium]